MLINIDGAVGLRNRSTAVRSLLTDQLKIIGLLAAVDVNQGGTGLGNLIMPGGDGVCPRPLADAIWGFQGRWRSEGLTQDGVVDRDGRTLAKLNALATQGGGAGPSPSAGISVRQVNPPALTAAHSVTNPVISPLMQGSTFSEFPLTTNIHELLFEVTKGSRVFWIGAAVPLGTIDFSRAQIFFHPTVVNGHNVHARDADYPAFNGGWSSSLYRYVALEGGQLAGARLMTMLVPFTTMGALGNGTLNMFADAPVDTLNAVMAAVRGAVTRQGGTAPRLARVGVSSFSSGISALRLFLRAMTSSGLVTEVNDFDSPFIVSEPKQLTRSPGAVSRCFTQHVLARPPAGWVNLPAERFARIRSYGDAHSRIGWMTYYMAMLVSALV